MAERRMFAKTIVLSDAFLDMPLSARCLYFTLGMLADDDGFVNSPKSIMRQCGSSEDDMRLLLAKKFLLSFETGVIVIKHWKINNYLRNDRYKETSYLEEKQQLVVEPNGAYTIEENTGIPYNGIPSIGKDRLGKDRLGKDNNNIPPQPQKLEKEHINGAEFVTMTNDEYEKLIATYGKEFTDKCVEVLDNYKGSSGRKYKSDYRAILSWVANKVNETKQKEKKTNAYVNETQSEYNDLDRFYN